MAGEVFRKRREELGLDILKISVTLKIKADYLSAIENDAFERLPAPVYTVGYIRGYAKFLDMDAGPIIEYYTEHLSHPHSTAAILVGYSKRKTPVIIYFAALVLISLAAYGIYSRMPVNKAKVSVVPQQESSKGDSYEEKKEASVASKQSRPVAPVNSVNRTMQHTLDVQANTTSWLYIKFRDGRTEEVLLQPGRSKNWKFNERAILKIGNAGGVTLTLDGRDLGSPGAPGQVKLVALPEETPPATESQYQGN